MNLKYIRTGLWTALLLAGMGFAGCDEELEINGNTDSAPYENIYTVNAFLRDTKSNLNAPVVELFEGSYKTALKLGLTKTAGANATAKAMIDADYLAAYNEEHGTDFELYPQELVALGNGGTFTIAFDSKQSEIEVEIKGGTTVLEGKTYAIPVTLKEATGNLTLKEEARHCMYLVKDMRNTNDCFKGEDAVKGFVYLGTSENPLNVLSFQLENGKYLWDVVALFAFNINYNSETGRPYIKCNQTAQFLLDNNETYIQPLRKRGIKVLMGLLGNHDAAGLAQLSDEGAKDFAREVAHYCKVYNLDGVNYDDEYSKSPDLDNPAYTKRGHQAAMRLCYESKMAMPDKIVSVYQYGYMVPASAPASALNFEGKDIDEWMDIIVPDYFDRARPAGNMTLKKCAGMASEYENGRGETLNAYKAAWLKSQGYGWYMGFCPRPISFHEIWPRLTGVEELYGSPLAPATVYYKTGDPTPYPYTGPFDR